MADSENSVLFHQYQMPIFQVMTRSLDCCSTVGIQKPDIQNLDTFRNPMPGLLKNGPFVCYLDPHCTAKI
jgi:hypothetical protein